MALLALSDSFLTNAFLMQLSATTTATTSSVCRTCAVIKKSSKLSCCARGGSWFGQCGAIDNTNFRHTWQEGIESCKARQPKKAIYEQQNAVPQNSSISFDNARNIMNPKNAIPFAHMFLSTSDKASISGTTLLNTRTNALIKKSTAASAPMPMDMLGRVTITTKDLITPRVDDIIINSGRVHVTDSSFHQSASASITTRKCGILLSTVIYVGMLFAIAAD